VAYNSLVKWREWTWVAGPTIAIAGWFAAPIIKSKMDGTALNGLPGTLAYWKHVIVAPMPAWAVFLLIVTAVGITVVAFKRRKKKADLTISVLPHYEPKWGIGAKRTTPFMTLHFQARFATTEEHSLEIVKGYLKGTAPVMLFSQIIVSGRYDQPTMVHLGVRPILAKPGEKVTRRVVLVDQHGGEHVTEKITFSDSPQPPEAFGFGRSTVNCLICRKEISVADIHPSAEFPTHRQCVK
jgi:hypothetical protein